MAIDPKTGLEEPEIDQSQVVNTPEPTGLLDFSDVSYSSSSPIQLGGDFGESKYDDEVDMTRVFYDPKNLEYERAAQQSGVGLIGKALYHTAVEAGIGSLENLGYAFDFEDLANIDNKADRDFDNWWSKFFREAKQDALSVAPIYKSEVGAEGSFGQKLGDATWWASQGETFGVTLGMMLPGIGAAKLGGLTAKGLGASSKWAGRISGLSGGLSSAKIEGTMEAQQKYEEEYKKWDNHPDLIKEIEGEYKAKRDAINEELKGLEGLYVGDEEGSLGWMKQSRKRALEEELESMKSSMTKDLDERAKLKAGTAASLVYRANAIKAPLEVAQFMMMGKSFDEIRGAVKSSKLAKGAKIGFQPASEAGEELYQGFAGKEASRVVEAKEGEDTPGFMVSEGGMDRLGEFASSDEGKEAMFLGGLMGLFFEHVGPGVKKAYDKTATAYVNRFGNPDLKREELLSQNRELVSGGLTNSYMHDGGIDGMDKTMSSFTEANEGLQNSEKLSNEQKEEYNKLYDDIKDTYEYIKKEDELLVNNKQFKDNESRGVYIRHKLAVRDNNKSLSSNQSDLDSALSNSEIDSSEADLFRVNKEIAAIKNQRKQLSKEKVVKDKKVNKEVVSLLDSKLNDQLTSLVKTKEGLTNSIKETKPGFKIGDLAPNNAEEIDGLVKSKIALTSAKNKLNMVSASYVNSTKSAVDTASEKSKDEEIEATVENVEKIIKTATDEELSVIEENLATAKPDAYEQVKHLFDKKRIEKSERKKEELNQKRHVDNFNGFKSRIDNATSEDIDKIESLVKESKPATFNKHDKKELIDLVNKKRESLNAGADTFNDPTEDMSEDGGINVLPFDAPNEDIAGAEVIEEDIFNQGTDEDNRDVVEKEEIEAHTSEDGIAANNDEVIDKIEESEEKFSGDNKLASVTPGILLTTKAKEFERIEDRKVDKFDSDGKVILTEAYDPAHAAPENFSPGSKVMLFINKNFIKQKGKKWHVNIGDRFVLMTAENIPVSVQSEADFLNKEKEAFISLRDLSSKENKSINEDAYAKTLAIKQELLDSLYKGEEVALASTVESKDGGFANLTEYPIALNEALKIDNSTGELSKEVAIVSSNDSQQISIDNKTAINTGVPVGIPHIMVQDANGQYVAYRLDYDTLSERNPEEYDKRVETVYAMLESVLLGNTELDSKNMHDEISKIFFLRRKITNRHASTENYEKKDANNHIFGADYFGKEGQINVSLPSKKGYVKVILKLDKDGGVSAYRTSFDEATSSHKQKLVSKRKMVELFKARLDQMYPNVTNMSGSEFSNFETYDIVDGKLTKVSKNYADFLSEGGVNSRISALKGSDGKSYFYTQPNIEISENTKSISEVKIEADKPPKTNTPDAIVEDTAELVKEAGTKKQTEVEEVVSEKPRRKRPTKDSSKLKSEKPGENKDVSNASDIMDDLTISESEFIGKSSLGSFNKLQDVSKENELTESILGILLETMDKYNAEGASVHMSDLMDEVKDWFEYKIEFYEYHSYANEFNADEALEDEVTDSPEANRTIAKNMRTILDNFDIERNQDGTIEFIGFANKVAFAYRQLKFDAVIEAKENALEEDVDKGEAFLEGINYRTDPEKSVSGQIRRFLSSIPSINANGETETNLIGGLKKEDFGTTFVFLLQNLANHNINNIEEELKSLANIGSGKNIRSSHIAKQVYEKLIENKDKNPDLYNKFLSVFKKQNAKFLSLLQKTSSFNDITTIKSKVTEANKNGAKDVLRSDWSGFFSNFGVSTEFFKVDGDVLQMNTKDSREYDKRAKALISEFRDSLSDLSNDAGIKRVSDVFKKIGLNISTEALVKLKEDYNNSGNKKYFQKEFSGFKKGNKSYKEFLMEWYMPIFKSIANQENPFVSESGKINSLAVYETKFDLEASSTSFRNAAGKVLYPFVNPHHLSNAVDALVARDTEFVNRKNTNVFSKNSTWLNNSDGIGLFYFDASRQEAKGSIAKPYQEQSVIEKEVTKANLFINNGSKYGLGFTPSPSDKTTFPLIKYLKEVIKPGTFKDGKLNLDDDLKNKLMNLLVNSEKSRINQVAKENNEKPKSKRVKGYHYHNNGIGTGGLFFFIPSLNEIYADFRNEDGSLGAVADGIVENAMIEFVESEINKKISLWEDTGVFDHIDNSSTKVEDHKVTLATEYVINSLMSYANQYMLFTGDPAMFAKVRGKDSLVKFGEPDESGVKTGNWLKAISTSLPNMFKRIAKDIAPGSEGNFNLPNDDKLSIDNDGNLKSNDTYNVVFIEEPISDSEIKGYTGLELADAQEWTTLKEHLSVMRAFGQLNKIESDAILENEGNLTWAQIHKVMQPMKPVQVLSQLSDQTELEYYIKTSSFPLIKGLTEKFPELDKMRQFMESNEIDRMVPGTAVKIGYHNEIKAFDGSKFVGDENFSTKNMHQLNRRGFRIQQDVPFKYDKSEILEGSQLRKVVHADITDDMIFSMGTGVEIKRLNDKIHSLMYSNKLDLLRKSLGVKNGKITNLDKLKLLMQTEAIEKGQAINDVLMMNTKVDKYGDQSFNIPLFFHPMVHKVESLLNSIFKNKVLTNKLPGKSFVQGSSLGFEVADESMLKNVDSKGVIFTKNYRGKLDYSSKTIRGKKMLVAEILLPSVFKGVDLTQYVDSNGHLDTSKIDDRLLEMIGYRVPTQGFSSVIKLQVVGVLPEIAGDLVIVPGAITKQMGADFDVDKLFIHHYKHTLNEETGRIELLDPKADDIENYTNEDLQNEQIKLYHSILENEDIQKKSLEPLDSNDVPDFLAKTGLASSLSGSVLSDDLHSMMIENQAAGKIGIGVSSTWVTGHVMDQYSGTYIRPVFKKGEEPRYLAVRFSKNNEDIDKHSDSRGLTETASDKYKASKGVDSSMEYGVHAFEGAFRLDKIFGFDKKTPISRVLMSIQNEAVDNANNGNLFGMNLNKETFDVAMLIGSVGFDIDTIGYFLNQPIIKEYVSELSKTSSFMSDEFIVNAKDRFKADFLLKNGVEVDLDKVNPHNITIEEMKSVLEESTVDIGLQKRVIESFFAYLEIASEIKKVRKSLNTDTKFLGQSMAEVVDKHVNFDKNSSSKLLGNTEGLYKGTTAGAAHDFGITASVDLFGANNGLLPYDSEVVQAVFSDIAKVLDADLSTKRIEKITIGLRSALWLEAIKNALGIQDIHKQKQRLLYGEDNIAKQVTEAKLDDSLKNNYFIKSLIAKDPDDGKNPATVEHHSAKNSNANDDYRKHMAWLGLLNSPKGSPAYKLGFDLMINSIAFGTERGARDYGRFIPESFIMESGIASSLSEIDFRNESTYSSKVFNNFTRQFFQNNPNGLMKLEDATGLLEEKKPAFVKKFNKEINVSEVFEYFPERKKYLQLDTLGDNTKDEYDLDLENLKTVIKTNPKGANIKDVKTVDRETGALLDQKTGTYILEAYGFNDGISNVLAKIAEGNSTNSKIAEYLLSKLNIYGKYSLEEFNAENKLHNPPGANPRVKGRVLNNKVLINTPAVNHSSDFERTFLHEIGHVFTREVLNDENSQFLSDKQVESKKSLIEIMNEAKSKMTEGQVDKYSYAFSHVKEFASEVIGNVEFANDLNKIDSSFIKKISDFIKSLFGDLKSDSILSSALSEIIGITENISEVTDVNTDSISNLSIEDVNLTSKLGLTIDEWASLTKEERDNIKECN